MDRRNFVKISALSAAAASLSSFSLGSAVTLPRNWGWCGINPKLSDTEILKFYDRYLSNGIDGLLSSGSNHLYERAAKLARKAGIQLHAWRWTMNRGQYIKDHPEWYAVNRKGESCAGAHPPYVDYYRWLCPSHEEVKDIIVKDYSELCDIEALSGVHLDYVRYCDVILPIGLQPKYNLVQDHQMPEFDYCYCPKCQSLFEKQYGMRVSDMQDPTSSKEWHEFRLNQIVKLVHAIVEEVHRKGKVITGAVFPTPAMSRTMVRQNWAKFNLDAYLPMLYHNFYNEPIEWIGKCVSEALTELPEGTPVYAGIFRGAITEKDIAPIYQLVKKNGGKGLSFFTAESLTDGDLKIVKSLA